ncbi:hypothetical protein ACFIO0_03365 [Pseudosulfitobacter sp. SM2401]
MMPKQTISDWFKSLACLAFVFALVLSPPTASHAASGMHDEHHAIQDNVDLDVESHDHGASSSAHKHEEHSSVSNKIFNDQKSDQCCNDICVSAVLNETGHDFAIHVEGGRYLMRYAQRNSVDPSRFLRPPQFLI